MIGRSLAWVLCTAAGGAIGWRFALSEGLGWGVLGGAVVWQLLDGLHARRLLAWLRSEQNAERAALSAGAMPKLPGVWGELTEKTYRLLKARDQQFREGEAAHQEFLAALQASPNGVVLLDAQGRIEWCNQVAVQHFGFDAERDLQQHITHLVRDPGFASFMSAGVFPQELTIAGSFSTPTRPVKLSVHVNSYGHERKLLLSRDITALEQADAMRRDFVANVSHEIRTPLTVLSGFIETLQTLPLTKPESERFLNLMAQQSRRMQNLVDDLLTLSRLEGSPLPGGTDWMSSTSLLTQCEQEARALSALLAQPGQNLSFDYGPACELAGIHGEIWSALSNLVANAVRYTPSGGSIRVSWARLSDGRGEFSVSNSGAGIAPEHLSRLTERFYRVDRSRSRETGGTGLGLAIVKHVAQRHAAELLIESQPGQGAKFGIIFPASRVRLLQAI